MKKGYLILQDGRVFEGVRFGAETDTVGELVFTTGMCPFSRRAWTVRMAEGGI